MSNFYNSIPILKTKRSKFNLSYTHKTTCDMGQLIPIGNWICYPNEKYKIGNQAVVRLQPLVAPLMHRLKVKVAAFFVPWRLVWDEYQEWAERPADDTDIVEKTLPLWDNYYNDGVAPDKYSLWDYFARNTMAANDSVKDPDKNFVPNDMMRRAYNLIYNEYFMNKNVENEVDITTNNNVLLVNFKNDYFASALPFQQRGPDPAIALSLNDAPIVWDIMDTTLYSGPNMPPNNTYNVYGNALSVGYQYTSGGSIVSQNQREMGSDGKGMALAAGKTGSEIARTLSPKLNGTRVAYTTQTNLNSTERGFFNNATDAQLQEAGLTRNEANFLGKSWQTLGMKADNKELTSTFDANQLRLLMQMKKFLERNARSGARYVEQIMSRWGIFAGDARMQRPEFIYSTTNTIAVEDLPQLSEDGNTPQGHLVGKGTGAQVNSKAGYYTTKEHGMIIQLMWIVPDLDYIPQGFDRETLIHTRLQEYAPEFAHLSEQMIKKGELFFAGDPATDNAQFGYEPIWSELRHRRNVVSADMRDTFDYWHLARKFTNQPALNKSFIEIDGTNAEFKRIFATGTAAQGFIVAFGNECTALRPLPKYGTPGFVDHF